MPIFSANAVILCTNTEGKKEIQRPAYVIHMFSLIFQRRRQWYNGDDDNGRARIKLLNI